MELRQLEAFTMVATELHFGRAAQRLHMGQPTLSELVQRLEREVGTPLLTRTTRRVALTGAGVELLGRAKVILDEVSAAKAAVRRIANGDAGTVRLGITPPVAPVLAPHLRTELERQLPEVDLIVAPMWLPDLVRAVAAGRIDVAITCGADPDPPGLISEEFAGEPVLVGLRSGHRLAGREAVALADLARDRLGIPNETLFPAWASAHRQALKAAGITPPMAVLEATDLSATTWTAQPEVEWILTTASLAVAPAGTTIVPVNPPQLIPYTLQWNPDRAQTAAVARFVHMVFTADLPPGWLTRSGHLRHTFAPEVSGAESRGVAGGLG
jgi:DNA-binding transcriptional LysR family regulator